MCLAHTLKLTINKKLRIHPKKKVEEVMWVFFWDTKQNSSQH